MAIHHLPISVPLLVLAWGAMAIPASEIEAQMKREGYDNDAVRALMTAGPPGQQEAYSLLGPGSRLGFKHLRIGGDFAVKGQARDGDSALWELAVEKLLYPLPELAQWACVSQYISYLASCVWAKPSGQFATAFGVSLSEVQVLVAKPTMDFNPVADPAYADTYGRVAHITLTARGIEFLQAALAHFKDFYQKAPIVRRSDGSAMTLNVPTDAQCDAVGKKPLARLSAADQQLRDMCAAPLTGLLKGIDGAPTVYTFSGPDGETVLTTQRILGSIMTRIDMEHPKFTQAYSTYLDRVRAERAKGGTGITSRQGKDF